MGKSRNGSANGSKRPAGDKPLAAYVTSLTVENIRCFGPKQSLDLSDGKGGPARWTIILGENGTGKTTLLQALVCHELVNYGKEVHAAGQASMATRAVAFWLNQPVRNAITDAMGFIRKPGEHTPAVCDIRWTVSGTSRLDQVQKVGWLASWEIRPDSITERPGSAAMVYHAYGAGRRLARGALVEGREDDPVGTLFDEHAQLRNAEEWLLQLHYASLQPSKDQKRREERLEQVKVLLTGGLLIEVDDIRFITAPDPRPVSHVEFQTPYGWVPLRRLGYGYQTLIAWVVDFASRMVERYPDSPNPLHEPAIVVVDEIDLHLHPAWQRKLTTFLSDRFPNTQFIATAHSPLTVQAAEGANLAVLKRVGDHVEIVNDVDDIRNWRLDQIVTSDLFDLPSASPPRVERLFEEKRELLAKAKLSKADRQRLKTLQDEIDTLPVGDSARFAKEMDAIRKALDLLDARPPK